MSRFKVLDYVKIIDRLHGHHFAIGETVMISLTYQDDRSDIYAFYPKIACPKDWTCYSVFNKHGDCWSVMQDEITESTKYDFHKKRLFFRRRKDIIINKMTKNRPEYDCTKLVNWENR